jgi:hypothetical protein
MPREQFLYPQTQAIFQGLEDLAARAGVSRGQAFEDFLTGAVCALAGGTMEEEYLSMVERHKAGQNGDRGIDRMADLFGNVVGAMEETRRDILGDLFQGAITYGEGGQFLTPETVCDLIACMTRPGGRFVYDPCCGSGRMLLAAADVDRAREFIGQDIDLRCVRITAINLALRNLYGYVLWGDSLAGQCKLVYRTGFNGRGVIRHASPAELPSVPEPAEDRSDVANQKEGEGGPCAQPHAPGRQLRLF